MLQFICQIRGLTQISGFCDWFNIDLRWIKKKHFVSGHLHFVVISNWNLVNIFLDLIKWIVKCIYQISILAKFHGSLILEMCLLQLVLWTWWTHILVYYKRKISHVQRFFIPGSCVLTICIFSFDIKNQCIRICKILFNQVGMFTITYIMYMSSVEYPVWQHHLAYNITWTIDYVSK